MYVSMIETVVWPQELPRAPFPRQNMHACMHTHTTIHMHACMHTYFATGTSTCSSSSPKHACMHNNIHTYIHTYIHILPLGLPHAPLPRQNPGSRYHHACIHTHITIYTYIHTYIHSHRDFHMLLFLAKTLDLVTIMLAYIHT